MIEILVQLSVKRGSEYLYATRATMFPVVPNAGDTVWFQQASKDNRIALEVERRGFYAEEVKLLLWVALPTYKEEIKLPDVELGELLLDCGWQLDQGWWKRFPKEKAAQGPIAKVIPFRREED